MSVINKKHLREQLPQEAAPYFDDITQAHVLGASRHIRMIAEMVRIVAQKTENAKTCKQTIEELCYYFKETRGKSSYAIVNALNDLQYRIQKETAGKDEDLSTMVSRSVDDFIKANEMDLQKAVDHAKELSKDWRKVLIFDYSSTVDQLVKQMDPSVGIVIAESRTINGGLPFVKSSVLHDKVRFIADASIMQEMHDCDAVIIGAETFYPDGTAFNTVGSDIAALAASYYRIPYYVLTPLQKADIRALYGIGKQVKPKDLRQKLSEGMQPQEAEHIDFTAIECVRIKPEFITAYITEWGIVIPQELLSVLLKCKPLYFEGGES